MNKSDIRKVIGQSILADGMSPVIDLEKSHGSWLVDKVTDKKYKYADVIGDGTVNANLMRYELHRVWVVEATLKSDSKHIYGKRVFYLDEDSWAILGEDSYDVRGNLWRVGIHGLIQAYDKLVPWPNILIWHDLTNGNYLVTHLDNEVKKPITFDINERWSNFQPDALRRRGTR